MSKFFDDTLQGLLEAADISEVPKHKKRKQSSTSKSSNKAKHKHEYKECLFINKEHPHRGTYCTICGKVGDIHFFESERIEGGMYRQLDYDEVFELYKHLEQVHIDDIFQRFVPVSGKDELNL